MVGIKKECSRFRKENRNGILLMYNIRCDPELGVGKAAVRRIPCACSFCIEQLHLSWDINEMNWNIFEGLNDWNIITLVTQTKNINSEKDDEAFKIIIRGGETRMSEKLLTTMYGNIRIDDESTDGYYVLQWTSEPYTLQEDKEMEGFRPQITAYASEIVCDAVLLNPVYNAKYWYIPIKTGFGDVKVRL